METDDKPGGNAGLGTANGFSSRADLRNCIISFSIRVGDRVTLEPGAF